MQRITSRQNPVVARYRAARDRKADVDPILLDGSKFEARIGPLPRTPYREGIRETLAWFRTHPDATNVN